MTEGELDGFSEKSRLSRLSSFVQGGVDNADPLKTLGKTPYL